MRRISISSFGLLLAITACSSETNTMQPGGGAASTGGSPAASTGGGGSPAVSSAAPPKNSGATPAMSSGGGSVTPPVMSSGGGSATPPVMSGATTMAMTSVPVPMPSGTGGGGVPPVTFTNTLVTSANGAFWKTDAKWAEAATATADVTVDDTKVAQNWDGFGGAFNELGWKYLSAASKDVQDQAMKLLFGADGAHFSWGRIPIGASDYAEKRYTPDDPTGANPEAASGEANRPAADTALSKFALTRDEMYLIPYIKAAQAVNPALRFWASPWTPPVWMKKGYKTSGDGGKALKAGSGSYFDGGNMSAGTDDANLKAYAQYFKKFVEGYQGKSINIEIVSPQNEPNYLQNYPSCLWDAATYAKFVGKHLGPTMDAIKVKVMLGTLSNNGDKQDGDADGTGRVDVNLAKTVLADADAKKYLSVVGAQWGALQAINDGAKIGDLPVWATEHKCGNYPWWKDAQAATTDIPAIAGYAPSAPNDLAYGVESWAYLRNAINKGKVTSYSAWNMVLDAKGWGNDVNRDWAQDALLVVEGGKLTQTPAYYVFRHLAQYVVPGAKVVGTTGGDAVAYKNPDGSIVAVVYNKDAAKPMYTVAVGGKKLQFAMPAAGWATVVLAK